MDFLGESESIPRRTMVLFFVVDASRSMEGKKIAAVNDAIHNVLPIIREISDNNADAEIKVAALQFSSGAEWINPIPRSAGEFEWLDIEAEGLTDLGEACKELSSKLSRSQFLQSDGGYYAPAIILLSDGDPTDDYRSGIATLKANNWFRHSIRLAIAIGDDADEGVLVEFTGSKESVYKVHDIESLKKIIHLMAVSSTTIGSRSTASAEDKTSQVLSDLGSKISGDSAVNAQTVAQQETNPAPSTGDIWD